MKLMNQKKRVNFYDGFKIAGKLLICFCFDHFPWEFFVNSQLFTVCVCVCVYVCVCVCVCVCVYSISSNRRSACCRALSRTVPPYSALWLERE